MNLSLYHIDQKLLEVINSADENGCIDETQFEELQVVKKDKQIGICQYVRQAELGIQMIEVEVKRLQELKKKVEKRNDWLAQYLKSSMEKDNIQSLDFGIISAKIKNNPPGVVIENEDSISSDFIITKEVKTIDKTKIKEALKNGQTVVGAHLEQKTRIEIK